MLEKKRKIRYKNGMRSNGWSLARRKKQSKAIRDWKPWLKATGPRTVEGKARSAKNAWKHGFRSRQMKEIYRLLRRQRQFVKNVERCWKNPCTSCLLVSPPLPTIYQY